MLFCYVSVLRKKSRQPQHRTRLLRCCFPDPQPLRKRTGLLLPASVNQRFKIKKAGSHGPVLRTCLGRLIRSTYVPAFVRSRGQTPNAAKAGCLSFRNTDKFKDLNKKSRQPPTFPLSQYHRRRGA